MNPTSPREYFWFDGGIEPISEQVMVEPDVIMSDWVLPCCVSVIFWLFALVVCVPRVMLP